MRRTWVFFKDAGLNVEVTVFGGARNWPKPLRPVRWISGFPRRWKWPLPHRAAFRCASSRPRTHEPARATTTLAIGPNSTIATAKDLEGKTVAVIALKSMSELGLREWLGRSRRCLAVAHHRDAVRANGSGAAAWHDRGRSDYRTVVEHRRGENASSIRYPSTSIAPQFMLSAWFSTDKFISQNPDVIKKFATAILPVRTLANGHHRESGDILAKYIKIDRPCRPDVAWSMPTRCRTSDLNPTRSRYKYGSSEARDVDGDSRFTLAVHAGEGQQVAEFFHDGVAFAPFERD